MGLALRTGVRVGLGADDPRLPQITTTEPAKLSSPARAIRLASAPKDLPRLGPTVELVLTSRLPRGAVRGQMHDLADGSACRRGRLVIPRQV